MDIPGKVNRMNIACGTIKAYFMSETTVSRFDIEEITKSLRLISFEETANLVTASQLFINAFGSLLQKSASQSIRNVYLELLSRYKSVLTGHSSHLGREVTVPNIRFRCRR